jgi:hypothetical protein
MRHIAMRQAEMLSYLQGCGHVGEWVCPITGHISQDLSLARAQVCQIMKMLAAYGYIEMRYLRSIRGKEYRVLIRLETPGLVIVDHGERSEESKEKMRQKALQREARKRAKAETKPRKPLIQYSGFDKLAAAQW